MWLLCKYQRFSVRASVKQSFDLRRGPACVKTRCQYKSLHALKIHTWYACISLEEKQLSLFFSQKHNIKCLLRTKVIFNVRKRKFWKSNIICDFLLYWSTALTREKRIFNYLFLLHFVMQRANCATESLQKWTGASEGFTKRWLYDQGQKRFFCLSSNVRVHRTL